MSYPILYEANETVFGHFGLGVVKDTTEMFVEEERNGLFTAKMKVPVKSEMLKELTVDRIIKADANPNLKEQRFRIVRLSKPAKGMVTVYLNHVSHETEGLQLKPKVSYDGTGYQALNTWKANIVDEHEFTVYSDITHFTASGEWSVDRVENARRALGGVRGSILDSYGGEYRFDNYHISLLQKRGNDNGVFIAYGKNLTDLEQEEEIANTYTSVYPYAIVRDEENDTEDLITLPEYYIDSEHVENFAKRKILTVDFSEDEIDNVDDLRSRAERYIEANNIGVPNVNLTVNFVDLAKTLDYKHLKLVENIDLCDIVSIYFPDLDINTSAKVIKVKWNVLLDRYEEIQLGQPRASLSKRIEQTVEEFVTPIRKRVEIIQVSANGKNKVYRSEDEPTVGMNENDIWFQPVGEQEYKQYVYDGIQWIPTLSSELSEENKRLIREAKETAERADKKAQDTIDDIQSVVNDNGFTTLADLFASKITAEDFGTMFYQNAEAIGLVYEENGDQVAIIGIQDGLPYIKGKHVVLDGNTIVDGDFTVTEQMLAPEAIIEHLKATGIDANDVNIINLNVENISAGDIDLSRGFRITNNGQDVLSVNAQTGQVVFNAPNIATDDDVQGAKDYADDKVSEIEVGGQNLLRETSDRVREITLDSWGGFIPNPDTYANVEPNETYTASVFIDSLDGTVDISVRIMWFDEEWTYIDTSTASSQISPNQSGYISTTVTSPDGAVYGKLDVLRQSNAGESTIGFKEEQIIQGNTKVTWSQSLYDIQDELDSKTDSEITKELQDQFSDWQTISATREEVGEIQSALYDYLDALEANEANLDEARQDIADLLGRMPIIENNLGQWVEQWNFLETYVRLGDEGLLIQEINGATGIRITSNRIDFLDGSGEPVAYISDQVMRINRGIFVDSAQIGEHKIETIEGGHTIWQWMS